MHAVSSASVPKPLYCDPIFDGAADVSIAYDRGAKLWNMFYTNRRATFKLPEPKDGAWVHGADIGIATSSDGVAWRYQSTAKLPKECTSVTSWAPELYYEKGVYDMWLTVVPCIFSRWGPPGSEARMVHVTSRDLSSSRCDTEVDVGINGMIDASVIKLGSGYRMRYKDETAQSHIMAADPNWSQHTVIQVAELVYKDGWLTVDRNVDLSFELAAPTDRLSRLCRAVQPDHGSEHVVAV